MLSGGMRVDLQQIRNWMASGRNREGSRADIGMAKAQKRLEAPYKKKNKKEAICAFSTGKKTRKPTARTPRNYCILRYRQVTTTNLIQGMPGK